MSRRARHCLTFTSIALMGMMVLPGCGNRTEQKPAAEAAPPAASAQPTATEPPPATPPAAETVPPPAPAPPPAQATSKPKPPAESKPAPPPAPKPEPIVKTVAAGTDVNVEFISGVSSKTSKAGDPLRAKFTDAVVVDGVAVIPAGTIATGIVTEAVALKKIGGTAKLGLKFDTLEFADGSRAEFLSQMTKEGKSESGKDAGTIAGATAGGAILGRVLSKDDKTKGTLIGAAVGAAAGTGIAAATKGTEVEFPAGTQVTLRLDAPLTVTIQR